MERKERKGNAVGVYIQLCYSTSHLLILVRFGLEHVFGPLNVQQNIGETANCILEWENETTFVFVLSYSYLNGQYFVCNLDKLK